MFGFPSDNEEEIQDHSEDKQLMIELWEEKLGRRLNPQELFEMERMFNSKVGESNSLVE
jgi:hypothetical protein